MSNPSAPVVSIILPTYNRGDVLPRSVGSVLAQTFADWELIVVDDGSTDASVAWLESLDEPRIRVLQQANAGVYHARNAGLQQARGRYVTFLDSDDEWLPHYLALTTAFLDAHPGQMFVTTEFYSHNDGVANQVFDRVSIPYYARRARRLGLGHDPIARPHDDPYLSVYSTREPVGAWGEDILRSLGRSEAQVYRGHIFRHMRWGYLNWLPITMLRREALPQIGEFSTATRSAADFRFMALLCRNYPAAMIAVPCAHKHENNVGGRKLKCDHLASGAGAHRFEVNKLRFFDELFFQANPQDRDLAVIRRHYQLWAGRTAVAAGLETPALEYLSQALSWHPAFWSAAVLWLLVRLVPNIRHSAALLRLWTTLTRVAGRIRKDPSALPDYGRRLLARLTQPPARDAAADDLPLGKT
ncbi:MAG: glycosyltransferase family 2 protein [Burkholderiaceae bacterium]|nr:glycosyltransferase family 2 protein [Burkholderiaceae bacterium]